MPPALGVHFVASIGCSVPTLSKARNWPVWHSMLRPPTSAMVSGLMLAAGTWEPNLRVPPLVVGALELLVDDDDAAPPVLFALPHAARIAPMTPVERPTTAPFCTNWRRLRRPLTSSSM